MKQTLLAFAALLPLLCCAQPANDNCPGVVNIPVNWGLTATQSASGTLNNATHGTGWICGNDPYNDVWYSFTATHAVHLINVTNINGAGTLNFEIRGGSCTGETWVCGNSAIPDTGTLYGFVPGDEYYIRVYSQTETIPATTFQISITSGWDTIVTNNTQYTIPQLVQEVFAAEPGFNITNITSSTGSDFGTGQPNGIAYFEESGYGFPFPDGIVLSTGNALDAAGPNNSLQNAGTTAWPGDDDLEAAFSPPIESVNATSLEFDFVPESDQMEFDFIFASEEYGLPGCSFSDRCAILLTSTQNNTTVNLALVPLTIIPIYGGSIHGNTPGCPAENIIWFSGLNAEGEGPTNFNGQTVYLVAQATVVPGAQYHLKIVIADGGDTGTDSALLLKGGSLELSDTVYPGPYIVFETPPPFVVCEPNTDGYIPFNLAWIEYITDVAGEADDYTFTFYETTADAEAGTSPLSDPYTNTTAFEQTIYAKICSVNGPECQVVPIILQVQNSPLGTPVDYYVCDNDADGSAQFDLTSQTEALFGPDASTFYINFYETEEDAVFFANAIANPEAYTNLTNLQTVYVMAQSVAGTTCTEPGILTLHAMPGAPVGQATQTFEQGETLASLEVDGANLQWFADAGTTQPLPATTLLQQGATYYVSQTIEGVLCGILAVTVELITGVETNTLASLGCYPNPVKDELKLEYTGTLLSATLYNALGQEVLTQQIGTSNATLNLVGLANGMYMLKVEAENGERVIKIVKS